jgi:mannitol 2-dehydrogenase
VLPTVRDQLDQGGRVELAALAIAAWRQYLRGTDDAGERIDLAPDPRLDQAEQAAGTDPSTFLDLSGVFGDVGQHPRLRAAVADAAADIEAHGIRATIDARLGSRQPRNRSNGFDR